MKIMGKKGATMTFLVSIWIGIIIASWFAASSYPGDQGFNRMKNNWDKNIFPVLTDPISQLPNLLKNAFASPSSIFLISILVGGSIGLPLLANYLLGGGFTLLFAVPLVFIFAIVNLFVLPTTDIIYNSWGLPAEIQFLYIIFITSLTFVTLVSFTTGRQ